MKKHKAEHGQAQGQYKTESAGTMVFTFNNDYSMMKSKSIKVMIAIIN